MIRKLLIFALVAIGFCQNPWDYPEHALKANFLKYISVCRVNATLCTENTNEAIEIAQKIGNDYTSLLHPDLAQTLFQEAFYFVDVESTLGYHLNHQLAVLAFSQGDISTAEVHWSKLNTTNIASLRSLSAQVIMKGNEERRGMKLLEEYGSLLIDRLERILLRAKHESSVKLPPRPLTVKSIVVDLLCGIGEIGLSALGFKSPLSGETGADRRIISLENLHSNRTTAGGSEERVLLNLLLSEAQGKTYQTAKYADLQLSAVTFPEVDTLQRFSMAVGLAKLGLFDLSLRHVWLSAAPWESPLYLLRAKLIFSPVHKDVRSLALAVDHFERHSENILLQKRRSYDNDVMDRVCNSPNEVALALQALPLLHLAGYSSPRASLMLGHSPASLTVLLSEVFRNMCPPHPLSSDLHPISTNLATSDAGNGDDGAAGEGSRDSITLRLGVVSGSADGIPGKIVLGIMSSIARSKLGENVKLELIAMCFPTARDANTDAVSAVFDQNISLPPDNKTEAVHRIRSVEADLILFADAALDSRVFTLAHERLATWQANLWGFGGTLGIKTIDFYIVPEPFLAASSCPTQVLIHSNPLDIENADSKEEVEETEGKAEKTEYEEYYENVNQPSQSLFSEQVVFLKGLPPLPKVKALNDKKRLYEYMHKNYMLPYLNETHLYLFPGTVRHMHPEFDAVLDVLLRDTAALVVLAVPRTGRDSLPTVHEAVRHDLMHPTNPVAAVSKLRNRLRSTLGIEKSSRVRVLPPLDELIYHALRRNALAMLDPFPVGMHYQILDSLREGLPVISAPQLQECTHSHMPGIARALSLSFWDYPTTPEEYAVLALRLQRETYLRLKFTPPPELRTSFIPRDDPPVTMEEAEAETVVGNTDKASKPNFDMLKLMGSLEDGTHGDQLVSMLVHLKESIT